MYEIGPIYRSLVYVYPLAFKGDFYTGDSY